MIDLHCHILPGIDDGAADAAAALEMARAFVADGVSVVACTPHILPGLYHNTGQNIRAAVAGLQAALDREGIGLRLVPGADNHIAPNCVARLGSDQMLPLAGSRYVLIELPHHVASQRMEAAFFDLQIAGYVPILTHPERLRWVEAHYEMIRRLTESGVWMQVTTGSLAGVFGSRAQYWAERMLDEGYVHVLATDAHDPVRRRPDLGRGRELAARRLGEEEAWHLVSTRPRGVIDNVPPSDLPLPVRRDNFTRIPGNEANSAMPTEGTRPLRRTVASTGERDLAGRLRRLFA
jgi:protein-tyrosine phosphatase